MSELMIPSKGIVALKETLKTMKPTKDLAVKWLNLVSICTSTAGEAFKKACVAHLKECVDCEEFESEGLKLKLIERKVRVYKETKETKAAEKKLFKLEEQKAQLAIDIDLAKAELQAAYDRAGFIKEKVDMDKSYYKAV